MWERVEAEMAGFRGERNLSLRRLVSQVVTELLARLCLACEVDFQARAVATQCANAVG